MNTSKSHVNIYYARTNHKILLLSTNKKLNFIAYPKEIEVYKKFMINLKKIIIHGHIIVIFIFFYIDKRKIELHSRQAFLPLFLFLSLTQ